ncbi:hypothetical protein CAPTEDRAFT_197716 [Capitella teleta]|uniref:SRCR domain-containing protein n=1 Tax=Capitella teleta TaxID=283909 RepID=R7TZ73_CAPTE|nr:hypothetical protein CAPTEDRAFT_197716 [Capitella teleta]|eukprot:ELT99059.1 hypothetical protein CAPTEDRAFT_197716 [Capitella teleta]
MYLYKELQEIQNVMMNAKAETTFVVLMALDIFWKPDYDDKTDILCAALKYIEAERHLFATLARSDCRAKKQALCVKENQDDFANLHWGPESSLFEGQSCIQAVRNPNGIELISSDCGDETSFICVGDETEVFKEAAVIGGVLAAIFICLVLISLCLRKKKARSEAPTSGVAYVNNPEATGVGGNVYTVGETSWNKNGQRQAVENTAIADTEMHG